MFHFAGESRSPCGRLAFDRHLRVELHGLKFSSESAGFSFKTLTKFPAFHDLMGEHLLATWPTRRVQV
jgi:hypothetical protein